MPVRSDAMDRAKEAIKLMDKGLPITQACKKAGTSYSTVRKVMRKLKRRVKLTRTPKGRKRVIVDAHKIEKAQCVARRMQYEGVTATQATRECHTTIRTVRDVRIDGCPLLRYSSRLGRYQLQIFEVNQYAVVFFGRLRNVGSPIAITYTTPLDEPAKVDKTALRDDDYASIMWQYDFEIFHSTLSPEDLCEYYMDKVLAFLQGEVVDKRISKTLVSWLARFDAKGLDTLVDAGVISRTEADEIMAGTRPYDISVLEEMFKLGVVLDEEIKCGCDDRHKVTEWACKSTVRKKDPYIDDGRFQVLVLRRSGTARYPPVPRKIPYSHRLLEEIAWTETR